MRLRAGLIAIAMLIGGGAGAEPIPEPLPRIEPAPPNRGAKRCLPNAAPHSNYFLVPSCTLVIMMCHYCNYDETGRFVREHSQVCGLCLSGSF